MDEKRKESNKDLAHQGNGDSDSQSSGGLSDSELGPPGEVDAEHGSAGAPSKKYFCWNDY